MNEIIYPTIKEICASQPAQEYVVKLSNKRDLRFSGWELANASNRWTVLTLYLTSGGNYIAKQIGQPRWQVETDWHSADVCDSIDSVIESFGMNKVSKEIFAQLDIDTTQIIE